MSVVFIYEIENFNLNNEKNYRRWLIEISRIENKSISQIEIIFVNDRKIKEINRKYLNHFYLTDIITFDTSFLNSVSGSIYISVDTVKKNCKIYSGNVFEKELNRVIAHGILHLIGYNDKTLEETKLMREKEDVYLKIFG